MQKPIMYSLQYLYIVTGVFNIPFNTIALVENLEPLYITRKLITDQNGNLNRSKLLVARCLAVIGFALVTLISDNITRI